MTTKLFVLCFSGYLCRMKKSTVLQISGLNGKTGSKGGIKWKMQLIKELKTTSPKTTAKLIHNNVYCFFKTIFRFAIQAFFRFTDVTELM